MLGGAHIVSAKSILYVDPNAVMQALMVGVLHQIGHKVLAVADSRSAIETVRGNEMAERPLFDIFLLNLTTLKSDGPRLCSALRALGAEFAALPVIALARDYPGFNRDEFEVENFAEVLGLPVDWRRLQRTIIRLTNKTKSLAYGKDAMFQAAVELAIFDPEPLSIIKSRRTPEQMRKILSIGIASIDQPLSQMRWAYEQRDLEVFFRALHMLKGMAGQIGGLLIATLAERFEKLTLDELYLAEPLLDELQGLTDELRRSMININASLEEE